MILYKHNNHNGRYYTYDMDDYDLFDPMFDENLHDTTLMPPFLKGSTVCGYCQTKFESRNKLFYHLGFHNINVNRQEAMETNEDNMEPIENIIQHTEYNDLGDYGMSTQPIKNHEHIKERKEHKKMKKWLNKVKTKRAEKQNKRRNIQTITNIMADMNLR